MAVYGTPTCRSRHISSNKERNGCGQQGGKMSGYMFCTHTRLNEEKEIRNINSTKGKNGE
jgi:hypothetical protein